MRGSGKTTRSGSWEGETLAIIVSAVARRNGWEPACTVATIVPRADQLGESDFNFITRLARQYDCTAKISDGKLIVMPRQGGVTASGNPPPAPAAWFMAPIEPNLTQRMLNELSELPVTAIKD